MIIDPSTLDRRQRYRLMISALVPRPIAWVTTLSANGSVNAAPFSFFGGISASPLLLGVSVGRREDGRPKDTLANAEREGEMVVNMAPWSLRREMVACSKAYPPGVSEADEVGLALADAEVVGPPRIAESPVSFECEVERILTFPGTSMIVGHALRIHVDESVEKDGLVDFAKLRPLGRLGGIQYLDLKEGIVEIPPVR